MDTAVDCGETAFGPWNPGITSHIPREIRHLATIFRPENVFTDLARAEELRDLTGLDCSELVTFRPERLALHELLIRVTADFSVPDGSKIEDLGINFRRIVGVLLTRYIEPDMGAIRAAYDRSRNRIAAVIATELAALFPSPASAAATRTRSPATRIRAFFAREERARATSPDSGTDATGAAIAAWEAGARTGTDALRRAACRALARVASALFVRHGRIWADRDTIAALAEDLACNAYGSEEIGRLIEPMLMKAVAPEGFTLLPRQERPVVMNTKGASASGKSTLRPRQKELAEAIGVRWSEFALISPDIWRKQLLDYASLGPAYKYGGAFTGEELQIIDQKLDRYMARKAERGEMTHLLIDRFRFDSFAPDSDEAGSNLLTRFGHSVYLFFMITPPESLVERAWKRGLEVGRYKAVDDTLGHGIEAYSGMPQLFFTWVRRTDKRVHFEFLDNSVRLGERPRTVAFGSNGALNVLDVKCLLDVERYRRVNVDATVPEDLYPDAAMLRPDRNAGFLRQCVERFAEVNFADQATGRICLSIASGVPVWCDRDALRLAMASDEARAGIEVAAPAALVDVLPPSDAPRYLGRQPGAQRFDTLGAWGTST
jgi:hypothetical protein